MLSWRGWQVINVTLNCKSYDMRQLLPRNPKKMSYETKQHRYSAVNICNRTLLMEETCATVAEDAPQNGLIVENSVAS